MNEFRMDNTEGYNEYQLVALNSRLADMMGGYDENDRNYSDHLKNACEQVQEKYDNELSDKEVIPIIDNTDYVEIYEPGYKQQTNDGTFTEQGEKELWQEVQTVRIRQAYNCRVIIDYEKNERYCKNSYNNEWEYFYYK